MQSPNFFLTIQDILASVYHSVPMGIITMPRARRFVAFLPLLFAAAPAIDAAQPPAAPVVGNQPGQAGTANPSGKAASRPEDVPATPDHPAPEELALETSDGIQLKAWYYAVAKDATPAATVILVHDLEGDHKSVEPLALSLQELGFAVVAPDLRGHGASTARSAGGRSESLDARTLRKNELEAISQAAGGTVREQSAVRGDIEAVRNWIKRKSDDGELDINRLCVVGSGAGAILVSMWTAADWAWPPIATGPQGRQVRAVVLVSPVWATKGISVSTAMASDTLKHDIPLMVLGGGNDRDAERLFEQLRRQRPAGWFEQRPGKPPEKSPKLGKIADADLVFIELDSTLSADKLATDAAATAADRIKTFLSLVLDRRR